MADGLFLIGYSCAAATSLVGSTVNRLSRVVALMTASAGIVVGLGFFAGVVVAHLVSPLGRPCGGSLN
jgi:hypothetical protein